MDQILPVSPFQSVPIASNRPGLGVTGLIELHLKENVLPNLGKIRGGKLIMGDH